MVGAGYERLRGIGAYSLRNPVQLGALACPFVLARCMLMSPDTTFVTYLVSHPYYASTFPREVVSSLAPCLVRRDRERADAAVRVACKVSIGG